MRGRHQSDIEGGGDAAPARFPIDRIVATECVDRDRAVAGDPKVEGELKRRIGDEHRMPPGVHGKLGQFRSKAVHPSLDIRDDTRDLNLEDRAALCDVNLVHPRAERRSRALPIPPRHRGLSIDAAVEDLRLVVQPPPLMRIPGDPETRTNLMA